MSNKAIFWDFDGTLAFRHAMFRKSCKMVLDKFEANHKITEKDFEQWFSKVFPWDEPGCEHLHLNDPEVWWENMYHVFERAFTNNGISDVKASIYAREARKFIIAPEYYTLFDDTFQTLRYFKGKGYRNIILSNHIPELSDVARSLGLFEYVDSCICSACVGYEKPNKQIYKLALESAAYPEEVWMVGDNVNADVIGAENCGIPAILVRKHTDREVKHFSADLLGVIDIIENKPIGNHQFCSFK